MSEQYKYETIDTAKVYLAEGWYTLQNLRDLLEVNERTNEHLKDSMKQVSGHLKKIRKRNE